MHGVSNLGVDCWYRPTPSASCPIGYGMSQSLTEAYLRWILRGCTLIFCFIKPFKNTISNLAADLVPTNHTPLGSIYSDRCMTSPLVTHWLWQGPFVIHKQQQKEATRQIDTCCITAEWVVVDIRFHSTSGFDHNIQVMCWLKKRPIMVTFGDNTSWWHSATCLSFHAHQNQVKEKWTRQELRTHDTPH